MSYLQDCVNEDHGVLDASVVDDDDDYDVVDNDTDDDDDDDDDIEL